MRRDSGVVFHGPPDVVLLAAAAKTWNTLYIYEIEFVNKLLGGRDLGRKTNLTKFLRGGIGQKVPITTNGDQ